MDDKLLHKWLNDTLTEAERIEFESRPDYGYYKELLQDAQGFKAEQFSTPHSFADLKSALPAKKEDKLRYLRPLWKVAAVLVIAFGLYFTVFNQGDTTVETAFAEQTTLSLPDESEVILNANSSLSYVEKKWEDTRAVKLNGEAYFKVAKGKVFDVLTKDGKVSVLGTQFRVVQRDGFFQVICYEGRVAVNFGDAMTELTPGKAIRLLDGQAKEFSVSATAPAWINNKSTFKDVPFKIVLDELERQYNITVNTTVEIQNRSFNGVFTHDDLQNAMIQITAPLKLEYSITDKEVTISEQNP